MYYINTIVEFSKLCLISRKGTQIFNFAALNAVTFEAPHCLLSFQLPSELALFPPQQFSPLILVSYRPNVSLRILVLISVSVFIWVHVKKDLTYVETHQFPVSSGAFICLFGLLLSDVPCLCLFLISPIPIPRQWLSNSGSG